MKYTKAKAIWVNAGIGCLNDLLSVQFFFGAQAAIHTVATTFLYSLRGYLYPHKLLSLPFFTLLFSITISFLEKSLVLWQESAHAFSWKGITTDIFVMSFFDALYAFCFLPKKRRNVSQWSHYVH